MIKLMVRLAIINKKKFDYILLFRKNGCKYINCEGSARGEKEAQLELHLSNLRTVECAH